MDVTNIFPTPFPFWLLVDAFVDSRGFQYLELKKHNLAAC